MKIEKTIQRNLAIEAGFYDGRFRERIVTDKKKQAAKYQCRTKNPNRNND